MMPETALAISSGERAVVALTVNRRRARTVFHEFHAYLSRGPQPVRSSGQAEACGSRCDDSRGVMRHGTDGALTAGYSPGPLRPGDQLISPVHGVSPPKAGY